MTGQTLTFDTLLSAVEEDVTARIIRAVTEILGAKPYVYGPETGPQFDEYPYTARVAGEEQVGFYCRGIGRDPQDALRHMLMKLIIEHGPSDVRWRLHEHMPDIPAEKLLDVVPDVQAYRAAKALGFQG